LNAPPNLGEAKHLLANQSNIYYWLGATFYASGDEKSAITWWRKAAKSVGDFQEMSVRAFSEMTYYSAMALLRLGEEKPAKETFESLLTHAKELAVRKAAIDYFATSLPSMLLFHDDVRKREKTRASFLRAQALVGLGRSKQAEPLLRRILQREPDHPLATDLVREIDCETRLKQAGVVVA